MAKEKPLLIIPVHSAGLSDVAHLQDGSSGTWLLVTCGQDGKLCYRQACEELLKGNVKG